MPRHSTATIKQVTQLLNGGLSARKIHDQTGVSLGSISWIRKTYCPHLEKKTGGRPRKLSDLDIRHASRMITTSRAENAVQVTRILRDTTNLDAGAQTIRRALKRDGFKAKKKVKKPKLTKRHRRERMDFARRYEHMTEDDWARVIWSDETKVNLKGSDGKKWVWVRKGEGLTERTVEETVKFGGGSVMIWGCMLWEGVGNACRIDGIMDADLYVRILEEDLLESIQDQGKEPGEIIFQQDNDPKHTSKKAKTWFEDNGIEVLAWPAQSPDLNPIEHLWGHLKRKLGEYEEDPKGVLELWERIQTVWAEIDTETCQNLIRSMPRRIQAVIKAKGGWTKY